jgi:hypothetical protein
LTAAESLELAQSAAAVAQVAATATQSLGLGQAAAAVAAVVASSAAQALSVGQSAEATSANTSAAATQSLGRLIAGSHGRCRGHRPGGAVVRSWPSRKRDCVGSRRRRAKPGGGTIGSG